MAGRSAKVKNKHAASVQITAEQLLREANERQIEYVAAPPRQDITDPEELNDMRMKKRKGFEDAIRKNRANIGNWIKYAAWEDGQGEVDRARSVYERTLPPRHPLRRASMARLCAYVALVSAAASPSLTRHRL